MLRIAALAALLSACTTYTEDGELVRHHFGYVRVITPAVYAPDGPVQAIAISNFGLWLDVDRRTENQNAGSGAGLGYRSDRQDILPYTCRVVFRVATMEQFDSAVAMLEALKEEGRDICVIKEE